MDKYTYLNIETENGLMQIPFLGLRGLDYFTSAYQNSSELIDSLTRILDLSVDIPKPIKMYISDERYNKNQFKTSNIIKYSKDLYLVESLVEEYTKYLYEDKRRITNANIKNFISKISYNRKDVENAVKEYFKDYLKQRETYFQIKDLYEFDVKIKKIGYQSKKQSDNLKFDLPDNSHISSLIERVKTGDLTIDELLDELSKTDLENMKNEVISPKKPLFDGLKAEEDTKDEENIYVLERTTGMSISMLKNQLFDFRYKGLFR